jgi:hypothetical protein
MSSEIATGNLLPKYPREVIFIDELPKTGTGKIDRQALLRGTTQPHPRCRPREGGDDGRDCETKFRPHCNGDRG